MVACSSADATQSPELGVFNYAVKVDDKGIASQNAIIKDIPSIGSLNVTLVREALHWGCVEPEQSHADMKACRDVAQIDELLANGKRVQPVLRTNSGMKGKGQFWATVKPESREQASETSYAPRDLTAKWSNEYGYSKTYYEFVQKIIDYYCPGGKCRIDSIVIENEANSAHYWYGSGGDADNVVDEYVRLVKTAKKAIDDAQASIRIFDSGLQSAATLWVIMALASEHGDDAEVRRIYEVSFNQKIALKKLKGEVKGHLGKALVRKVKLMLDSDLYSVTDGLNFHHYHSPESVPIMVDFFRSQIPPGKLLITNEAGIKRQVIRSSDPEQTITWMSQKISLLFAHGVSPVIWFSPEGKENAGMLLSKQKETVEATTRAFAFLGEIFGEAAAVTQVDAHTVRMSGQYYDTELTWPSTITAAQSPSPPGCSSFDMYGSQLSAPRRDGAAIAIRRCRK